MSKKQISNIFIVDDERVIAETLATDEGMKGIFI